MNASELERYYSMPVIMSNTHYHTFKLPEVTEACVGLISENAEHLINFIYQHADRSPYDDAKVRVGLAIKIILKPCEDTEVVLEPTVLEPVMQDLEELIRTADTQTERRIYTDELRYIRDCTIRDDLISLNTTVQQ